MTNAVSRFPMIFSAIVLLFFVIGFVIWIGRYIDARAEAREKIIATAQSKLEARQDQQFRAMAENVRGLNNEVQDLRARLAEVQGHLQASQDEIFRLRRMISQRDETVEYYRHQLDELERRITDLDRRTRVPGYQPTAGDRELVDHISRGVAALKAQMH